MLHRDRLIFECTDAAAKFDAVQKILSRKVEGSRIEIDRRIGTSGDAWCSFRADCDTVAAFHAFCKRARFAIFENEIVLDAIMYAGSASCAKTLVDVNICCSHDGPPSLFSEGHLDDEQKFKNALERSLFLTCVPFDATLPSMVLTEENLKFKRRFKSRIYRRKDRLQRLGLLIEDIVYEHDEAWQA